MIADRSLFSTAGYTAPECMNRNDGTLRLTRASDIYSCGYLLLRMMTGKWTDQRTLQLVMNGKYLYRRRAQKIGCTQNCEDMVNQILCRSLAEEPEERYQSVEELSSSSDMSQQLREALEHSEYLIVVLSERTAVSSWVNREIALFLETHTRDHILLLLAEGEPEQVIPECLKSGEKQVLRSDHTMMLQKQPVESLAADIRCQTIREQKKKLKTEVYRLLAPMLGCGYDDLRQRQREYRLRRTLRATGVAAVLLALFAGFAVYQAMEIHTNYWQVLKEKSRYLANTSAELLSQGDRIGVIQTAVEALPEGEKDHSKPLTPEAEAALNGALYSYQIQTDTIASFQPERLLTMDAQAEESITFASDGSTLLTTDQNGSIYLWNTEEGSIQERWDKSQLEQLGMEGSLAYAVLLDDSSILILSEHTLLCLEVSSSQALWKRSLHEDLLQGLNLTEQGQWEPASEAEEDLYLVQKVAIDRDNRYVALSYRNLLGEYPDSSKGVLELLDKKSGEVKLLAQEETDAFWDLQFQQDGTLAALSYPDSFAMKENEVSITAAVQCFDADTGEQIWKQSFPGQTDEKSGYGLYGAQLKDAQGKLQSVLSVWSNRNLLLLEQETGKILSRINTEQGITGVGLCSEDTLLAGEEDGTIFTLGLNENASTSINDNLKRQNKKFLYQKGRVHFIDESDCSIAVLRQFADDDGERLIYDGSVSGAAVSGDYLITCIGKTKENGDSYSKLVIQNRQKAQPEVTLNGGSYLCGYDTTESKELIYLSQTEDREGYDLVLYDMAQSRELWRETTSYSELSYAGNGIAVLYSFETLGIVTLEE